MVLIGELDGAQASKAPRSKAHDDEGAVQVRIADQPNIIPSPEKMFVAIMAMLQLMASGIGVVKSLWTTVMLPRKYLGFITMTLFFESIHFFCQSSKLALHHMHNIQQLPKPICYISWLFYWLELLSVMISGVLSAIGLVYLLHHMHNMQQDSGQTEEALVFYVFYVMAILEALVFLAPKAIWKWKVSYCRLLEKVKDECGLTTSDIDSIRRFFYVVHSKCVAAEGIPDALKMDLVTFAGELLVSCSGEEQLMGARILKALSTHQHYSDDALRKIGTSKVVIERLIQMLNCKFLFEENIRCLAAVIVSELAGKEPNVLLVAGIEEAMKSAHDLLGPK